jgi:hexulose-6-phosphate isomerase
MRLGVMQGRLCPQVGDRIQAFPGAGWSNDFAMSRELGLSCIEWVFEEPDLESNPIMSDCGIRDMRQVSGDSGVAIGSVVADYFMTKRLFGEPKPDIERAVDMLRILIRNCRAADIPLVELPFVDASALKTAHDQMDLLENLKRPLEDARKEGVAVGLETSLPPKEFRRLLDALSPWGVRANYDMGNSSSLGFDPAEEIPVLGKDIGNVHIKDRVRGGGTVPLGQGDTDFGEVFRRLKALRYDGDFIFQSARQDLTSSPVKKGPVDTVREYLDFMRPYMESLS